MTRLLSLVVLAVVLSLAACGGSSSPTGPSSSASGSHNAGRDCIGCHNFTVAGTVYKSDGTTANPTAIIRLTTAIQGGGNTVVTLTADRNGNFYTATPVGFGTGLYATATGTTGSVASMTSAITGGGCNRCHTAGARIVVN